MEWNKIISPLCSLEPTAFIIGNAMLWVRFQQFNAMPVQPQRPGNTLRPAPGGDRNSQPRPEGQFLLRRLLEFFVQVD